MIDDLYDDTEYCEDCGSPLNEDGACSDRCGDAFDREGDR